MTKLPANHNEDENRDEVQDLLWIHRIKATAPRRAILELLLRQKTPLPLIEIVKKSKKESRASVYRTLELFVHSKLLNLINTGDGNISYELIYGRKHHHHVICTKCGELEDVSNCLIKGADEKILSDSKKFRSLSHHSLEFFGLCKNCS